MTDFSAMADELLKLDPRLGSTFAFCEATSFERMCLWQKFHNDASYQAFRDAGGKWVEDLGGYCPTLGYLEGRPSNISLTYATICGVRVCFYESVSMVVDHALNAGLISELSDRLENAFGARPIQSDAMNFHNFFGAQGRLLHAATAAAALEEAELILKCCAPARPSSTKSI